MLATVLTALCEGFLKTLELFALTLLGSLPLGLLVAFGSMSRFKPLSLLTRFIVWIVRGTPLMLQLLVIYYGPGLLFGVQVWAGGRYVAALTAFIFNYACYFSEIYRGGIEAIPRGQIEAGQVLGMSRRQIFFRVTLLQVVKRILPPISNEVITLVKDTSLAFSISVMEMFTKAKALSSSQTSMTPLIVAGVFYYVFNFIVAFLMERIEKKMNYYK